ncbi:MAG: hypothetical protein NC321_00280 [Clostridium sp.]|nr:hypothetical protein [Clostridium sp.]
MNDAKVNIGNNQQEKIITKELKIDQNVFIYNETMISLPNISRMRTAASPKQPYPLYTFAMILFGLCCLFTKNAILILIGLAIAVLGGWIIYRITQENEDRGEYLVLSLNSGETIYLYCANHNFSIEIMETIVNCINSGSGYRINMENCTIESCSINEYKDNIFKG